MDTSASVKFVNVVPFEKLPVMKAVTSKEYSFGVTVDATVMIPDVCPIEKKSE